MLFSKIKPTKIMCWLNQNRPVVSKSGSAVSLVSRASTSILLISHLIEKNKITFLLIDLVKKLSKIVNTKAKGK